MTSEEEQARPTGSRRKLVRTGTTVDQMVRAISDRIVTGGMHPGEKLDEASLAERYKVSRTPVREALSRLSAMGLVERRPNRGAIVAVVSRAHLASMFESMAELEAICARFCAERMTEQERRSLEIEHRAAAELVAREAEADYELFNSDFHTRLYRGAHSPHMSELASQTRRRLAPFRRAQFRLDGRLQKSWREHDRIVQSILARDAAAAGSAARDHLTVVGEASVIFVNDDAIATNS
ncbi:GntR family transcriptional regulator [Methylosinus sp. LW4]|uniref:GntR family transcriptional regulator n=1 Tax=Methylosinus sp. LW4 TaxID=136993 RepID=UPI00039B82B6